MGVGELGYSWAQMTVVNLNGYVEGSWFLCVLCQAELGCRCEPCFDCGVFVLV